MRSRPTAGECEGKRCCRTHHRSTMNPCCASLLLRRRISWVQSRRRPRTLVTARRKSFFGVGMELRGLPFRSGRRGAGLDIHKLPGQTSEWAAVDSPPRHDQEKAHHENRRHRRNGPYWLKAGPHLDRTRSRRHRRGAVDRSEHVHGRGSARGPRGRLGGRRRVRTPRRSTTRRSSSSARRPRTCSRPRKMPGLATMSRFSGGHPSIGPPERLL